MSTTTEDTSRNIAHLCDEGVRLLTAWLRAEPRLLSVLPEIVSMPAQLLTAASDPGDAYLNHLHTCMRCRKSMAA